MRTSLILARHYCLLVAALAAVVPAAAAQQVAQPGVTYLAAGDYLVAVVPDSLYGVLLSASALTAKADTRIGTWIRMDPTELFGWLPQAERVAINTSAPLDSAEEQGPMMVGLDGTNGVLVGRLWDKRARKSSTYWVFRSDDNDRPLLIKGDTVFSRILLTALKIAAVRSHVSSASDGSVTWVTSSRVADSTCPKQLNVPKLKFPRSMMKRGVGGIVDARYVVDTAGQADLATFEVVWASDSGFVPAVKDALTQTRFRAAYRDGRPVRQRVYQRYSFRVIKGP